MKTRFFILSPILAIAFFGLGFFVSNYIARINAEVELLGFRNILIESGFSDESGLLIYQKALDNIATSSARGISIDLEMEYLMTSYYLAKRYKEQGDHIAAQKYLEIFQGLALRKGIDNADFAVFEDFWNADKSKDSKK